MGELDGKVAFVTGAASGIGEASARVRLTADRPDQPDKHMDEKEANVFHLDDKGRAYEFWGVADDQASLNSFWTD
jgi:NAD(P)-dependent dehydrogenase (short-subunit alcohol dehydrogenase family)